MDKIRIYYHLVRAAVQSRMEYRASFFMYVFTVIGFYAAQISVIGVMLARFKKIGGWEIGEIAFLYSLLVISLGMVSMIFSGMLEFSEYVREGTFDRLLLRPLGLLPQILANRYEPAGVAHLFLGIVTFIFANNMIDIQWTPISILFFILVIFGGTLILASVRIVVAALAFFTVSNAGLQHLVVFSSREFLLYPIDIYDKPVRFFLTFVFPIAFINFYPAHYFLNKDIHSGIEPLLVYMTVPVGILMFIFSLLFWKFSVGHYTSTGT